MKGKMKRGLSPVIATILLVAMVVVLGTIVFLWFRGFTEESITKFGGTNVKLVCGDVKFESDYSSGNLFLSNVGNVPIYSFKLKIQKTGSYETIDIKDIAGDWPVTGLNQGGIFSGDVLASVSGADGITVIPILRGSSTQGPMMYTCEEQYGEQIVL
jgi:flagellin-like protein